MKKTASMAIAALMVLGTAAFGCAAAAETAAESVIGTVLNGYQATYQAATQDLIADNGASFNLDDPENHHVIISVSDEGVTFEAEGMSSPQMGFGTRLDVEGTIEHNQAVHLKFKPSGTNFSFSLWASFGVELCIGGRQEPYINVMDKDYQEAFAGDLSVEPGNWYHLLAAVNPDGVLQAAMWKDGDEGNVARLNLDLYQSFHESNYRDTSWEFCVSVSEQNSITINSYEYYTFTGFVTEGRVAGAQGNAEDGSSSADSEDFGPPWTINIADNFEVAYNTIWDQLRPQVVTVGNGDEYIGYCLKDLLDFSDNGSTVATVWFSHDGENNLLVEPTFDAYVVFIKNGEWTGNPYLITIDGVSKDPVTDVYP
jgi:hypothetical protein